MFNIGHSRVIGLGALIPETRISSKELMQQIDSVNNYGLNPAWLERATGIKERRCADPQLLPSDMAVIAAREALERAEVRPDQIDMIIYAGVIRDHALEPGTGHIVQHKLKASKAIALDLNNACLGFMSALHVMDAFVAAGQVKYGLIVTGEKGMQFTNKAIETLEKGHDRAKFDSLIAGLTLGDAGAAMLIAPKQDPQSGFMGFQMESRGEHADLCYCGDSFGPGLLYTDMSGILKAGSAITATTFKEMMEQRLQWEHKELNGFVAHQTGKATFKLYSEQLRIAREIMTETVWKLGNIITATIPINLYQLATRNQQPNYGDKVFIAGAGSGVCAGHAGLVWDLEMAA